MSLVTRFASRGFSLVEMMVASLIGLIMLAGITYIFTNTVKTNTDALKSAHLHQELRAIMDIMIQDIRRSGYWSKAVCTIRSNILQPNTSASLCDGIAGQPNPFDVITINSENTCILYSYDATPNGIQDISPNKQNIPDERFGFRVNDGAIEMRQGGADCETGGWQDISDSRSILITQLQFSSNNSKFTEINTNLGRIVTRKIDIQLQGQLITDPGTERTVISGVHVRNDRYCANPNPCPGI